MKTVLTISKIKLFCMTSEKLEKYIKLGLISPDDEGYLRLAQIGDKRQEEQEAKKVKTLTIKYISCTADDKNYNLTFEVTAKIFFGSNPAKISITEANTPFTDVFQKLTAFNAFITIKQIGTATVKVSLPKAMMPLTASSKFVAVLTYAWMSAETEAFELKGNNEKDLTVEDVRNIVKTLREGIFKEAMNPVTNKKALYSLSHWRPVDKIFYRNSDACKFKNEEVSNNSFENFTTQLNYIFNKYEINNNRRRCHFLAQMFIETEFYTKTLEGDNDYTANYDPYRGRGFIQLTHDYSYKKYAEYSGYNVVNEADKNSKTQKSAENDNSNCKIVATNLEIAADSGGWYWKFGSVYGDINKIADTKTVSEVTKAVKGDARSAPERKEAYDLLIKIFNR
ncbi:hypothetical protein FACS1894180_4530 [Bacteroidia bacterium]|nr:hypothetical protein FACS1894180_4530 [Bacteroidia bacterium]